MGVVGNRISCRHCNQEVLVRTGSASKPQAVPSIRSQAKPRIDDDRKMRSLVNAPPPIPRTKPCTDCGGMVSIQVEKCPHCGAPNSVILAPASSTANQSLPMQQLPPPMKTLTAQSFRRRAQPPSSSQYYDSGGASKGCLILASVPLVIVLIGAPIMFLQDGSVEGIVKNISSGIILVPLLPLYFMPTIIGIYRQHVNWIPIAIVQTLLGWTIVIWCVCLAWSFSGNVDSRNPRRR